MAAYRAFQILLIILWVSEFCSARTGIAELPVVDLHYGRYRAAHLSEFGFYNFSNIRYAQPPIGDLRFRVPKAPARRNRTIDDGSVGRICPQTLPAWLDIAYQVSDSVLANKSVNVAGLLDEANRKPRSIDPRETEDCLFLDVLAPKAAFDSASASSTGGRKRGNLPVLVWFHPGGYLVGSKDAFDIKNSTLSNASYQYNPEGVIFVAVNYRLGAFGWLAGPSVQSQATAQPALYDQRLALEWVQNYIHLFGGNCSRVTVHGLSGGAGSAMHQIVAYGGVGEVPFQQAIIQSPAYVYKKDVSDQEHTLQNFLDLLGVNNLDEARRLPSLTLIEANYNQSRYLSYGTYSYGPAVDGTFVPDLPGRLLLNGSYHQNLKLLITRTVDEGLLFIDPRISMNSQWRKTLTQYIPGISSEAQDYAQNTLYPPSFGGSTKYVNEFQRADLTVEEIFVACNTVYLNSAFRNNSYAFEFAVPPGYHSSDLAYIFADLRNEGSVQYPEVSRAIQEYIMSFVVNGEPEARLFPTLKVYGDDNQILTINATVSGFISDPANNSRYHWWQRGNFY